MTTIIQYRDNHTRGRHHFMIIFMIIPCQGLEVTSYGDSAVTVLGDFTFHMQKLARLHGKVLPVWQAFLTFIPQFHFSEFTFYLSENVFHISENVFHLSKISFPFKWDSIPLKWNALYLGGIDFHFSKVKANVLFYFSTILINLSRMVLYVSRITFS